MQRVNAVDFSRFQRSFRQAGQWTYAYKNRVIKYNLFIIIVNVEVPEESCRPLQVSGQRNNYYYLKIIMIRDRALRCHRPIWQPHFLGQSYLRHARLASFRPPSFSLSCLPCLSFRLSFRSSLLFPSVLHFSLPCSLTVISISSK